MSSQYRSYIAPKYWPTWLVITFLRVVSWLPWTLQKVVAHLFAWFLYLLGGKRRHIVDVNLKLCFPEWDEATRKQKSREVIFNNMLGIIETANGYYYSADKLRGMVDVTGLDKLRAAKAEGRGILLLGAHYSHLDFGGVLLSLFEPTCAIYRPHNNPLMDLYIKKQRLKFMAAVIGRTDMRGIARALKNNAVVWYPPDQDYGRKHAVFAPFFGVNAATITATARLARLNQSPIFTIAYRRDGNRQHYLLEVEPLQVEFPTGDDVRDATIINQALEALIRRAPTQYMWTHRRFKTQPNQAKKASLYQTK